MDKKTGTEAGEVKSHENVDVSRRKLIRGAGKVAWVAPTLSILSFGADAQAPPPPPPSPPFNPDVQGASPQSQTGKSRTKSRTKSRKKTPE